MNTDVLIIGGGPSGLAAATELGERNLDVTIVDESYELGGQLRQQTQPLEYLPTQYQNMRGFELAESLVKKVNQQSSSLRKFLNHRVIGLYKDGSVGISDGQKIFAVKAKKIIVATGAYEKAIPFLKWTLPGIMTIGAAQTLINRELVLPGRETVIIGISDFTLDVVSQLQDVGITVKGIVVPKETKSPFNCEQLSRVVASGVTVYQNAIVIEAKGNGQVEELMIKHDEKLMNFQVDFVCLDGGRAPVLDVFYQLNCSFGYREALGGWLPQYDANFRTSEENIYIAGSASGISNHGVVLLTGMIAGISVGEELKMIEQEEAQFIRNSLWKEVEVLESKGSPMVWEERKLHINHFSQPMIKDQFIS
ncbi:NAD(P)/FAD-dependent oxidoreductase [Bacillus sp. FJAT-29937]|uniref:NAD(P)/FAD-dependent oxidoreductase n=1 Tax=Bacillus sp. FJAT-29937 TaxID=1720553 RepID=UPI00082D4144|nr:FAD-dependent oxidoreductase [Bacillus sp. FJAT-29937]